MSNYKDLFDEVVVTAADVEFWLDHVAKMQGRTNSARSTYYKNFDVASKIAVAKLNGSFDELLDKHAASDVYYSQSTTIQTIFKDESSDKPNPCPNHYHVCDVRGCKVRKKLLRKARNARYYAKKMGYTR